MKLGVSAFAWTGKFDRQHLHLLPLVKEMGLDGFEIPMFDPAELAVAEIRRAFEANQLECTVCAILPQGINPISPDAGTRQKSLQHLVRCVETAADLDAKILCGPLFAPIGYLPGHRSSTDEWRWAVEIFQQVCETADKLQLQLSIEPVNRAETFFLRTAREAKAFCNAVGHPAMGVTPVMGVTIDTFHANIEEKNIAEAVLELGPLLKHLHASENDRGPLGTGHVDFPGILAALHTINYDGYLMIEGFGYDAERKDAPGALWADPLVSPEQLASNGARYLRGLLPS